jgi:hypothetical protein
VIAGKMQKRSIRILGMADVPHAGHARLLHSASMFLGDRFMPSRILALFNLRPGIAVSEYEHWARTVDLPTVNALPSVDRFEVFRVTGKLGSADAAPYAYAEIIDINNMAKFGEDVATERMQAVAAEFGRLADPVFLTTEPLD